MVTDMSYLFCVRDDQIDSKDKKCQLPKSIDWSGIDISGWDTRQVTDMKYMRSNNDETFGRGASARTTAAHGR